MRKMENYTYIKWNKMWRLWKRHKLETPLEELVTYDNYMAHGHLEYFKYLKNDLEIKRNMWIIKKFLSKEIYANLEKAYKLYNDNLSLINNNQLDEFELEKLFMKVDEKFYEDAYEMTKIIMREVSDCPYIKVYNFREKYNVLRKLKSSKKS